MPRSPLLSLRRPLLLLVCVLLIGGLAWHLLRAPLLPGYRLESRELVQRVVASGTVDSQSLARVGSEITAVVAERHVREGDAVRAGDLLLSLRDEEQQARLREAQATLQQLIESSRPQAQAALREATSNLQQARRERERREALFQRQLLSTEQRDLARRVEVSAQSAYERARLAALSLAEDGQEERQLRQRLESARVALARTRILAQVDGVVQSRSVEPGDLVQPGSTLLEIARLDSREIRLPLDEKNLAAVQLEQPAQVVADAYPNAALAAQVSFIAPAVDPSRGTIDVHLQLLENADFLRQGMTVSVNIETARRPRALVIPRDALFQRQGNRALALRLNEDRVEAIEVRLGLEGGALVEVLEGLADGDLVLAEQAEPGSRARLRPQPLPGAAQ
ncbi:efflux RND transporter periplasmic adaptor subunit [Pseudomonas mangrovi]|uniref:Efflux RND transporter periplasmic adaptor subunit n=1 Tax=Pseudomonas mangrovi TaxID=2161748 RepID=A0A2T5P7H4_9PSED|nr:efflux RND transporter periplasmic adaptor subunit [Pseudomonas mangrovi]